MRKQLTCKNVEKPKSRRIEERKSILEKSRVLFSCPAAEREEDLNAENADISKTSPGGKKSSMASIRTTTPRCMGIGNRSHGPRIEIENTGNRCNRPAWTGRDPGISKAWPSSHREWQ